MHAGVGKYVLTFVLDERCECLQAGVHVAEGRGVRQVIKTLPGPFDSPDEILATYLELIQQAEWRGEQLRLPVSSE